MRSLGIAVVVLCVCAPLAASAGKGEQAREGRASTRRASAAKPRLQGVGQGGRALKTKGFNGFDSASHAYQVVAPATPLDRLPTVVKWSERSGTQHQTHLFSGDLGLFQKRLLKGGGIHSVEKATLGARWTPSFGGDY